MRLELDVDDSGMSNQIRVMQVAAGNFSRPLKQFQSYMIGQTFGLFNALRHGGTYRGVTWPYFKNPRYIRKTDGVAVPPWGGVPYARKKMTKRGAVAKRQPIVKGQMREPGNQRSRLKNGDALLQSSRSLIKSVTHAIDYQTTTQTSILWGTRLSYAEKQNRMRPFLFFVGADSGELERLIAEHQQGGSNGSA